MRTGQYVGRRSHISGGIDSYYEYLLKCDRLFGDADCRRMWEASVGPMNRYLADTTSVPGQLWYGVVDMDTGARTSTTYGALDAFVPGMLALGAGHEMYWEQCGNPEGEPIVQYGPFVMNSREEIEQALRDYRDGVLAV